MRQKCVITINSNPHATTHTLLVGDCLKKMDEIPNGSIDLIITDPPYNIGLDYGLYKDNMKEKEYFEWSKKWLQKCRDILSSKGSMYLISYPEINARLFTFIKNEKIFKIRRWLTWHYPTNIGHSKKNFTRSQRAILFLTKTDNYTFNRKKILQPYRNPDVQKVKDLIKKGRRGRASYDGFTNEDLAEAFKLNKDLNGILRLNNGLIDFIKINLLKNVVKDRMRNIDPTIPAAKQHPCQLPSDLLRFLINVSSNKGDIILDPFAGTFTTSKTASELDRHSIGIEKNPRYVKMGIRRLSSGNLNGKTI